MRALSSLLVAGASLPACRVALPAFSGPPRCAPPRGAATGVTSPEAWPYQHPSESVIEGLKDHVWHLSRDAGGGQHDATIAGIQREIRGLELQVRCGKGAMAC